MTGSYAITRRGKRFELVLEGAGVRRAWSLAKEPPREPGVKRLAFELEAVPEPAEPWDEGTWQWIERDGFGTVEASLDAGKLHCVVTGKRLSGELVLARTKKGWLLFLGKAKPSKVEPEEEAPPVGRLALDLIPEAERALVEEAPLPAWIEPMLPSPLEAPTREPGRWLNELKIDGIRVIAVKEKGQVRLFSRRGNALERQFPEVVDQVRRIPVDTLALDGEICVSDAEGRPRFQLIQPRIHVANDEAAHRLARESPVICYAFDLLFAQGLDLRRLPLVTRKALLKELLPEKGGTLRYLEHIEGQAEEFLAVIGTRGIEGMVQKRADSPYASGRSTHWWKVKCGSDGDFVVAGHVIYESTQKGSLGGLLLGLYIGGAGGGAPEGDQAKLIYVGGVGTGWTEKERRRLRETLDPLERATTPFHAWTGLESFGRGKKPEKIVWVEPRLVARCHYQEFTDDGKVIRCSFLGLEQRDPLSCAWLPDAPLPESLVGRSPDERETRLPRLTNAKKVFFPETGTTKGDLFRYYEKVAPVLLPHLRDRPMTLRRLPDGIHGFDFYQKHQGKNAPEWLRTVTLPSQESGRNVRYAVVDDLGALLYCIQLGCISLSPWSSRLGSLENPDWSIVDLDPGEKCTFDQVIAVARLVREILEELGLRGYPKTSGATGIHVVVPLEPVYTYEHSRLVAEIVATIATERHPELCTVARSLKDRPPDRVYVDFLQNARGKHVVAPYSVREVPSAAVSAPLRWDELRPRVRPEDFTIANEEERLRRVGDLFRPVLEDRQSLERALARRGARNDRRR